MKVILIKIYAEEKEMVHVSVVSGTPLGLWDMTVISQITDRWRDERGPVGPHRSHNFSHKRLAPPSGNRTESSLRRVSPRLCRLLNAIYTSLSL